MTRAIVSKDGVDHTRPEGSKLRKAPQSSALQNSQHETRGGLPATMRGLKKIRPGLGMELCEGLALPTLGPHDVLVKVRKAGICGTDRGIYEWGPWAKSRVKLGIIIGHEVMGTIAAVG